VPSGVLGGGLHGLVMVPSYCVTPLGGDKSDDVGADAGLANRVFVIRIKRARFTMALPADGGYTAR